MILDRYYARRFLWSFAGVFGVFFMILAFVGIVDQMRRFSGADATFGEILVIALLAIPAAIYQILPLIMIIATIALFLGLARSSELVVTRAAGRSALRAIVPPVTVALIIGLLSVAFLNPIVAATSKQYEARSEALTGEGQILTLGLTGLWLRQGNAEGQTVIRAANANLAGTTLNDVSFITFDRTEGPNQRIEAGLATLEQGAWVLRDAKVWSLTTGITPEAGSERYPLLRVPSTLTADQIRDSFGSPASIPIWELPNFINRLQNAGFSAQRHLVWLQMELAQPLFLVSMVLIGAAFTLRPQRGGRTGMMVLFAILLSFSIYFLRNFAQIMGENGQLPALLAAWAPPLAAIGLSLGLLLHNEDG